MQRLYIKNPLSAGINIVLSKTQSHYIKNVMRKKAGDNILLFNGIDGEWLGEIITLDKITDINIIEQTREQEKELNLTLVFAPIKFGRIDYLIQKATELGVSDIQPVFTERTVVKRINIKRLRANAMEASEQSERLTVPEIKEMINLNDFIKQEDNPHIILCDETGHGEPINDVLQKLDKSKKYAILIGPEGGFTENEFNKLRSLSCVTSVSLGKRILRSDTASLATLACFQCVAGDWC